MIEFNTADGEKLTIMHDGVVVKGYPGSDRSVLFIGGNFHALLHSYDEVVATMEHFVYGPDQVAEPPAPTEEAIANVVAADAALKEAMAARNADVHDDEGNVGHGAAAAAAEAKAAQAAGADALNATPAATEAPGAGTEHQSA